MHSIFSFFTGAGFLDLGFEHAGFRVDMVNEFNPEFLRGYRHARRVLGSPAPAYGHHLGSVEEMLSPARIALLKALIDDVHRQGRLVGFVGGPPCPDFSVAGKNAGGEGDNGRLTGVYFELIREARPDFFIFENVEGLWRTKVHRQFYDAKKAEMTESGYVLNDRLTNAICYGAPQDRSRIFLFGCLDRDPSTQFPWDIAIRHDESVLKANWPTTDAFVAGIRTPFPADRGIDIDLTIQTWFERNDVTSHPNARQFFAPKSDKFSVIPEGSVKAKSFKRLHRWRYSPTAAYGNNEVHLHPYEARRISVAEALAIQSLPKEFELPNDMTLSDSFKTIGNGVPYLAAKGLAQSVMAFLEMEAGAMPATRLRAA